MKSRITTSLPAIGLAAIGLICLGPAPLLAQEVYDDDAVEERAEELEDAREVLTEAAEVVRQMHDEAETRQLLDRARAVFIVPDYARASLIAGAAGGEGVLIARTADGWSGPAFYNIGAVNFGAAAGIEAGSIAFLLLSDDALEGFEDVHNFSLNADAGLTIVNWSERAQASVGKGVDVVVWSDTEGLYGDIAISIADIFWDRETNAAYYGAVTEPVAIIVGRVDDPQNDSALRSEFSALEEGDAKEQAAPQAGPQEGTPEGTQMQRSQPKANDPTETDQ
jgi:SH3 domain-containing YSC84-like protein 1